MPTLRRTSRIPQLPSLSRRLIKKKLALFMRNAIMCSKTNLCKRHRTPRNHGIAVGSAEQRRRAKRDEHQIWLGDDLCRRVQDHETMLETCHLLHGKFRLCGASFKTARARQRTTSSVHRFVEQNVFFLIYMFILKRNPCLPLFAMTIRVLATPWTGIGALM
jgi:hypothetical protein